MPVTREPLLETPRETLARFRSALAADPSVRQVYIGGSVARGDDDEVSDLDLWIEGENWKPESLGGLFLVADLRELGGFPFLHGVAIGGTIIDILIGQPGWDAYLPLDPVPPQEVVPAPLPRGGLVEEFWSLSLKHRKNLCAADPGCWCSGSTMTGSCCSERGPKRSPARTRVARCFLCSA